MTKPYIIAEAAQGFEGNKDVSKLLVRSAAVAGADAIKFQLVYADDLAEKGYEYYDLFKSLEMPDEDWLEVRDLARKLNVDFVLDLFGPESIRLAKTIKADGVKIHSTCFFDEEFIKGVLGLGTAVYLSAGGIRFDEVEMALKKFEFRKHKNFVLMYGFQSEPTPVESNNLGRIPVLREKLGVKDVGFMDHSDGDGPHTISLSAVAIGLGARVFEKHITLDRGLQMEDYVSALGVRDFAAYVRNIRELCTAMGTSALELTEAEEKYRGRAIKRVVAKKDMQPGMVLDLDAIKLSRASNMAGAFKLEEILGKKLSAPVKKGEGIEKEMVA